jgi:hypothetical protein
MVGAGKFGSANANGNGDVSGEAFILPENRRAARRTKVKGHRIAAVGRPRRKETCSSLDGITHDHAYFTPLPIRLAA